MYFARAMVVFAALLCGVANGLDCSVGIMVDDGTNPATGTFTLATCPTNYQCSRTETLAGGTTTTVVSCSTASACDNLCLGVSGCVEACCKNADDCNNAAVSAIIGTVNCITDFAASTSTTCSATEMCGRIEDTDSGTTTTTGSCAAAADCTNTALCASASGTCVEVCCNNADDCNNQAVANVGFLSCIGSSGSEACTAGQVCAKKEVTPDGGATTTTASCQAATACAALCDSESDPCVSACCSNADDCNSGTVAEITAANALRVCMVGTFTKDGAAAASGVLTVTTCTANQICGRTETTVGTVVTTVGSCQDSVTTCDLLCAGTSGCVSACCNNEDNCNRVSVTDMGATITCGTGTLTSGAFPTPVTNCATFCGRQETDSGIVGSCSTQVQCDALCTGQTNCASACCNNADNCNLVSAAVQNGKVCMVGTTTTVGSNAATGSLVATHCSPNMFCGRTETTTTANNVDTVVVVGSCQASADSCDLLCADDSNCVRACCNDADGCNSVTVAMMTSTLTCYTGTVSGTTLTATTACTTANHVCARTETTTGTGNSATVATVGSCQAQSACATLCGSTPNCVSACCSSSDLCNVLTVSQQTARNCYVGSSTSDTPVMDMTYTRCAASEQCGRTQTSATSGSTTTVTTVGSCTAATACDTLCGTAANCVSTCCDTDGCNSAAIATTTTTTTTTAATTTTGGAEHAAQMNMLVMMGLVVLGWFMA